MKRKTKQRLAAVLLFALLAAGGCGLSHGDVTGSTTIAPGTGEERPATEEPTPGTTTAPTTIAPGTTETPAPTTIAPTTTETPATTEPPVTDAPPVDACRERLAAMTLDEKIGQMLIVRFADVCRGETVDVDAIRGFGVAGYYLNSADMESREQLLHATAQVQQAGRIPFLLMCDEEGGRVGRLMYRVGTTEFDAMLTYKDQGAAVAYENARRIAQDMRGCGINTDLAPVADVWSNPENTVIGDRAYSDDFAEAATLIASAVAGFRDGGVACTLKHFPGHGDTAADTHYGSAYVTKTLDTLRREELLPFAAGIRAGADMVMIGHMILSDVEDCPCVFSRAVVTDLLRGELGFDGVVITDALEMQALTDGYGEEEIALRAIAAGVDLLLCPAHPDRTVDAIRRAVADGTLTESRLDESVLRVLRMKEAMGLFAD